MMGWDGLGWDGTSGTGWGGIGWNGRGGVGCGDMRWWRMIGMRFIKITPTLGPGSYIVVIICLTGGKGVRVGIGWDGIVPYHSIPCGIAP